MLPRLWQTLMDPAFSFKGETPFGMPVPVRLTSSFAQRRTYGRFSCGTWLTALKEKTNTHTHTYGSSPTMPTLPDRRWKSVLKLVKQNHLASSHWMSIDPPQSVIKLEIARAMSLTHTHTHTHKRGNFLLDSLACLWRGKHPSSPFILIKQKALEDFYGDRICLFLNFRVDSKSKHTELAPEANLLNTRFNYWKNDWMVIKMSS